MIEDLNAERALLGLAMARPKSIADIDVPDSDFAVPVNAAVWRIVCRLRDRGEPTDAQSVLAAVRTTSGTVMELRAVNEVWLADLVTQAPLGLAADRYARIVTDHATRRRLSSLFAKGGQMLTEVENVEELIEQLRGELDGVSRGTADVRLVSDTITETLDSYSQPSPAIPTPWDGLNHLIRGWRPGALYVVAARPGVGKSIVAIDAALGLAKYGLVAINSLEMPEVELHGRILANVAKVPINRIDARQINDRDWRHIAENMDSLTSLGISVDDRSAIGLTDVKSHARSLAHKGPVAAVIVDYLQLMEASPGDRRPRHELIASYSRGLKVLAKEMHIPVIALSQLNRGPESRADKRPTLADLRESGAIEQDADVVILLHEPDEKQPTELKVIVAKNRHGARDEFEVERQGHFSHMKTPEWRPHNVA